MPATRSSKRTKRTSGKKEEPAAKKRKTPAPLRRGTTLAAVVSKEEPRLRPVSRTSRQKPAKKPSAKKAAPKIKAKAKKPVKKEESEEEEEEEEAYEEESGEEEESDEEEDGGLAMVEALSMIKGLMSKEGPVVNVCLLLANGKIKMKKVDMSPSKRSIQDLLGGSNTILGQFQGEEEDDDCGVVMALLDPPDDFPVNKHILAEPLGSDMDEVRGDMVIMMMDASASPVDMTLKTAKTFLAQPEPPKKASKKASTKKKLPAKLARQSTLAAVVQKEKPKLRPVSRRKKSSRK